jgi:hypothetical protein
MMIFLIISAEIIDGYLLMFKSKSLAWLTLSLCLQFSARATAAECDMIFEDMHNYEVVNGGGLGFLGALVPGGALIVGMSAGLASAATEPGSSSANNSEKEISLRNFLALKKPQPEAADLNQIGFRLGSEKTPPSDCQVRATVQSSMLNGGRSDGDFIQQKFQIVRTVSGIVMKNIDVDIGSGAGMYIFQRKPLKRLKQDRSGKYIDVSSPMISDEIYNQKVADAYIKITVKNLLKAIKKSKVLN